MRKLFLDILGAPVFPEDEEKTRRARVLNSLQLNMGIAVLVLGSLGAAFLFTEKVISSFILLIGFITVVIGMKLNRRGRVVAGGILLLVTLWIMTVFMMSVSGGMRSLDIIFFVSGTVIAGILLGGRGALSFAGLSLLTGLAFIWAGNAGVVFPQMFAFPRWASA
jgi:hypothetical protein